MHRLVAATSAATLVLTALSLPSSAGAQAVTPTRTPQFARGLPVPVPRARPERAAFAFLARRRDTFGIARPAEDLAPLGTAEVAGQTVVRFGQRVGDVPVLGGQYVVHLRDRGDHAVVTGTSGHYFTGLALPETGAPTRATAAQVAVHWLRPGIRPVHVRDDGPVVVPFGRGILTRHVTVTGADLRTGLPVRKEVYVAAGRSAPVLGYDTIAYDGPVDATGPGFHGSLQFTAEQSGTAYLLRDTTRGAGIDTIDASGLDLMSFLTGHPSGRTVRSDTTVFPASAAGALDAHWGAERVYDFYRGLGRDGLDGSGGPIRSYVGVTSGGADLPNAFWDGREMVYGTGGYGYRPFAAALDVVGHEMTHGVVQHTAGLLGFGQSGALNEAVADYFGNSIENATLGIGADSPLDGLMGQDLCTRVGPTQCYDRDLDGVRTTRQFFGDPGDGGGVHENSTIVSGALWELRRVFGGDAQGDHRADEVVYLALQYLTPLADFVDAREAVVQAASDLGATPEELDRVRRAFDRRGVSAGWEKRDLHVDSTTLHSGLSLGGGLSVGRGRWAVTDAGRRGDRLPSVLVGDLHGGTARVLSPKDGEVYDTPATDGRSVAWTATDAATGTHTRVQVRRLTGGRPRTLATYRGALVWAVDLDGGTVAWNVGTRHAEKVVVVRPDGRRHVVRLRRDRTVGRIAVLGHQVVWSENGFRRHDPARLVSYDARTGRTRVLATVRSAGRSPAAVLGPVLTGRHLVYAADRGLRSGRSAVVMARRNGHRPRTLIAARNRQAPIGPELAASDAAVTFTSASTWHLLQLSAAGGPPRRMSCSRGPQLTPVAAGGSRVVWTDSTTGDLDLVTRGRPAVRC
jgi:bacillolysin